MFKNCLIAASLCLVCIGYAFTSVYDGSYKKGFYFSDPKRGFYVNGVNKPVILYPVDKQEEKISKKDRNYTENIRDMSQIDIRTSVSNVMNNMIKNPGSISEAEKYILLSREINRRNLMLKETVKDAYQQIAADDKANQISRSHTLQYLAQNAVLVFFLSYKTKEIEEMSRFNEKIIDYFSERGFRIMIVAPSFQEKNEIPDQILLKADKSIVDNEGNIANKFQVGEYPHCTAFLPSDGTIIPLYTGRSYVDKIENILVEQYQYYSMGVKQFSKVNMK